MKIKGRYSRYVTVVLLLSILPMGTAMGFFDAMKVHLFSEMKGVVTLEGKPVEGAVITRTSKSSKDKKYTDSTTTNSEGRFHFGRMEIHMFRKLLPIDIETHQKVTIDYGGQQYLAWEIVGAYDRNNSELNEWDVASTNNAIEINLKCELTAEDTAKQRPHFGRIFGVCTWEGQITVK